FEIGYAVVYSSAPATQDMVIDLSSSETGVTVPATVTIPEGGQSAVFTIEADEVATLLEATITATYGSTTRTQTVNIQPPGVQYIYFDEPTNGQLAGGETGSGTVTLHKPA